jgi:Spy/CpxP family protein refolding chaperone
MLGFLIGTLCLIALVRLVRAERQGSACGRGWHGGGGLHGGGLHGGGGWPGEHREWRDHGRSGWLRGLFERLDTSPGQEKVIRAAVEELYASTRAVRSELDQSRRDVAAAIRSGVIDETAMGELFARHDEKLREVRKTMVGALARVSEALDEGQRRQLADLLERGLGGGGGAWGGWRGGGGPYRDRQGPGGAWA